MMRKFKFDNYCEISTTMGNILWREKKCNLCEKTYTAAQLCPARCCENCYPEMTKIDRMTRRSSFWYEDLDEKNKI